MAARALPGTDLPPLERPWRQALAMLWRDKLALLAALYLVLMVAARCSARRCSRTPRPG